MKFGFTDILKLLPMVGPAVAASEIFIERFKLLIADKTPAQQDELKEALADIQADNDEGHARLQEKLARAAEK